MHGRLLQRAHSRRDVRPHRRDDPLAARRSISARRLGRKRRRQAFHGRRRGQDVDCGWADRRRVWCSVREDERTGARAHGRDARQARGDPRLPGRADDRRDDRPAARRRHGNRRADRPPRAGRQEALRAERRDRDRRHRASDRVVDHVEEARRRSRCDRARRQGRRRRVHEDARRCADAGRGHARPGPAGRQGGHLPAHGHGSAPRPRRRQRARDPRGARHRSRRGAGGLHRARARRLRPSARVLRSRDRARGRDGAEPRRRSQTARRTRPTSGGFEPRGRPEPPRLARGRRPAACGGAARRRRRAGRCARGGNRRPRARRRPAHEEDTIDHAVGVLCFAKRGDGVLAGDDLAEVHARDEATAAAAVEAVLAAYEIADAAPPPVGILLDVVS